MPGIGVKGEKWPFTRAGCLVWCNDIQNWLIRLRWLKKGQIDGIMVNACLWCPCKADRIRPSAGPGILPGMAKPPCPVLPGADMVSAHN